MPMAPANVAPTQHKRQLLQTEPQKPTSIAKKPFIQVSGPRKSLRLQSKPLISPVSQQRPTGTSSSPFAPISQPVSPKRKRSQDSEAEADEPEQDRPAKQSRIASAKAGGPEGASQQPQEPPLLSEEESQLLQSVYESVMDRGSKSPRKRTLSRISTVPTETPSDQTQRSFTSNAVYRRVTLEAVKVRFHVQPPDAVEAMVKTILNAGSPEERRAELDIVAKAFRVKCLENVKTQAGEADFLGPIRDAMQVLRPKNIRIREQASYRLELKPIVQQKRQTWNTNFVARIEQQEADASASLPVQQQQHNNDYISPESTVTNAIVSSASNPPKSAMEPPPVSAPEEEHRSPAKTPCPDFSLGIDLEGLISALTPALGSDAVKFIEWIQETMVQHKSDGPLEPVLILRPAPRAEDLTFPFAVIECKAYSTGKQIFEAENQAAVSMACAHNILYRLDRLANGGTTVSTQTRVLFSITTQGPIYELWAHWTIVADGIRRFESQLWDSWNGLVESQALDFIVTLYRLFVWGAGPFMKSLVENLKKVATQANT